MKLIIEQAGDTQQLVEDAGNGKKNFVIEGVFLQSEIKNKNGRMYPKHIMQRAVTKYIKESIDQNIAYGELAHPEGPTINPDRISHRITSLREDGNNYIGKAIINNNPMGKIAQGLMEDGGRLAVSSRGLGSLKRVGDAMQVQEDFFLATAADIVINPSAPDAFVNGIMEGREYYIVEGDLHEKHLKELQSDLDKAVRDKGNSKKLDEAAVLAAWSKLSQFLAK